MSERNDHPWKAEDLLASAVNDEHTGSARERINRYLDGIDPSSPHEADTVTTPLGRPRDEPADDGPAGPPIAVPNHELIRCLGAGGFGQVWLARHALTEHHRASKIIPADKVLELDGLRRLKQRVPAHPNLFPIEEVGAVDDWLYCLMPLADAATTDQAVLDHTSYQPLTLREHLTRQGRRSSAEVAAIGLDLAEGVRHLHEHGVTHGDIKPANIMRHAGRWTLADYGLARDLSSPSGEGHTPGYVPPDGPGTTGADQFALGVVLMELCTGWNAAKLEEFRDASLAELKLDGNDARLVEIIRRTTAESPADRFGSLEELMDALRPLAPDAGASGTGRVIRLVAGIVLVAVVALIAASFWVHVPAPVSRVGGVESFEVRHYRYDATTDTLFATGPINADNPAAREDDDVTVHAQLASPSYVYLVSLDADGRVRPRVPASPTETPTLIERLDYPSLPTNSPDDLLYNLGTGPGTQGFMLLVSDHPLPPWSDWIATRGQPTWSRESLPPGGVILFDGVDTSYISATRDPMPRRGQLLQSAIIWAEVQGDLSAVRFIAFPVLPKENE